VSKALLKAALSANQPTSRRGHSMKNIPLLIEKNKKWTWEKPVTAQCVRMRALTTVCLISVWRGGGLPSSECSCCSSCSSSWCWSGRCDLEWWLSGFGKKLNWILEST